MAKSGKHKAIFDAGALALSKIENTEGVYRCPICQRDFSERAISRDAPDDYCLTLEHAPPKSIGGWEVALTCKKCNNGLGSRLDSHISAREQFFCFIDPKRQEPKTFTGKITIGGKADLPTNIQISGKIGARVAVRAGLNNHPISLITAKDHLSKAFSSRDEVDLTFSVPTYDERLAKLGFLKSAFLCLFAKFGYTYAISKPARYIIETFQEANTLDVPMLNAFSECEKKIVFGPKYGLCFVGFGDFCLPLPWINANLEDYLKACEQPKTFLRRYKELFPLELPTKFEAIIDLRNTGI